MPVGEDHLRPDEKAGAQRVPVNLHFANLPPDFVEPVAPHPQIEFGEIGPHIALESWPA